MDPGEPDVRRAGLREAREFSLGFSLSPRFLGRGAAWQRRPRALPPEPDSVGQEPGLSLCTQHVQTHAGMTQGTSRTYTGRDTRKHHVSQRDD